MYYFYIVFYRFLLQVIKIKICLRGLQGNAADCPGSKLVPIFHLLLNGVQKLATFFKLLKTAARFKSGFSHSTSITAFFYDVSFWLIDDVNYQDRNSQFSLCAFFCLQYIGDKTWIKMPKWTIFLSSSEVCLFWLLRISVLIIDVVN